MQKLPHLTTATDDNGWTPLHYATDQKHLSMVRILLRFDSEAVYVKDTRGRTALHVAARRAHRQILSQLLTCRPGCSELVDDQGCNILHSAVESDDRKTVALILDQPRLSHLVNEKNKDGNRPLHHAATLLRGRALKQLMNDKYHRRVDKYAFNNENKNVRDMIITDTRICFEKTLIRRFCHCVNFGWRLLEHKDQNTDWELDFYDPRKEEDERKDDDQLLTMMEKTKEARLLAAALVATVTFTAGFTLPGGYVSDKGPLQGSAVLRKNAAFQVFIVMDTVAMVLSSLSVSIYLKRFFSRPNKKRIINDFFMASSLMTCAIGAMILAFITGTYAVLGHSTLLASATCALGLSFFLIYYLWNVLSNFIYRGTNRGRQLVYYRRT